MTKREELKELITKGETKKALGIAKTLDRTYNSDELRTLQIAYECLTGKEKFYNQMGIDTNNIKLNANILLTKTI